MGLNVIMMGAPGAGKGTQAARFARERGLVKISTGDILRELTREGNPIALQAKAQIDAGELVDDATMIAIVKERLARPDAKNGFVLDGFPRTVGQAEALDAIMRERDGGPLVIVDIAVPPLELVRRLSIRRVCATCASCGGVLEQRSDDSEEVVLERLNVYQRATRPVLEYYRARPTFRVVNGAQPPERVAEELDAMIDDGARVKAESR